MVVVDGTTILHGEIIFNGIIHNYLIYLIHRIYAMLLKLEYKRGRMSRDLLKHIGSSSMFVDLYITLEALGKGGHQTASVFESMETLFKF